METLELKVASEELFTEICKTVPIPAKWSRVEFWASGVDKSHPDYLSLCREKRIMPCTKAVFQYDGLIKLFKLTEFGHSCDIYDPSYEVLRLQIQGMVSGFRPHVVVACFEPDGYPAFKNDFLDYMHANDYCIGEGQMRVGEAQFRLVSGTSEYNNGSFVSFNRFAWDKRSPVMFILGGDDKDKVIVDWYQALKERFEPK